MIKVEKISKETAKQKGISSWPIWEKEVSKFPWEYEADEYCFILEGVVVVKTESKDFLIQKGDFVKFSKGLKCNWDIKKDIRKHYMFD